MGGGDYTPPPYLVMNCKQIRTYVNQCCSESYEP